MSTSFVVTRTLAVAISLNVPLASATTILVSPLEFDFGDVYSGTTADAQTVTLTNVTDTTQSLSLAGGAAGEFGGSTNCGSSLAPGASCEINYAFSPSSLGVSSGSTTLSVNGESYSFTFSGSGLEPILVSPGSFDFGNVDLGETSSPQTVTVTNVSDTTQSLSLAGGAAGEFGGSTNCGSSLAPGASCEINYAFTPSSLGDTSGSTTLSVNGESYSFSFEGTGGTEDGSPFLVTPLSFDFGDVYTGSSSTSQTVTITNVTDTTQSLSLAGGAAGEFGGSTNCGSSLAPGASCEINYAFSPSNLGDSSGSTTLSVNGESYSFTFEGSGIDPLLVSALSFNFGEIELGMTSPSQFVNILNVSDVLQLLSLAGGAAGVFGGATNCGVSLLADTACQIYYAFTPTALGPISSTTSLSVNGELVTFSFFGIGIGPEVEVPVPPTLVLLGIGILGYRLHRRFLVRPT